MTKFCSTEVDRICRRYQSLLSLPVRAQKMGVLKKAQGGSRRNIGQGGKLCSLFLKQCLSPLLRSLIYLGLHPLWRFVFFYTNEQNFPLRSPAAVTMRWRWDDPHGPSPSLGPESQGLTSDVQRKLPAMGLSKLKTPRWQQEVDRVLSCVCVKSKGSRKRPTPWLSCLLTACSLTELLSASVSTPATWGIAPTCFIGLGS